MRFESFLNKLDATQLKFRKPGHFNTEGNGNIDYANVQNMLTDNLFSSFRFGEKSSTSMFVPLEEEEFTTMFYIHTSIYNSLASRLSKFQLPANTTGFYQYLDKLCLKDLNNRDKYDSKLEKVKLLNNTSKLFSIIYSNLIRSKDSKPEELKTRFLEFFGKFLDLVNEKEKTIEFGDDPKFKLPFNRIVYDILNDLGKLCQKVPTFKPLVTQIVELLKYSEDYAAELLDKHYADSSISLPDNPNVPTWSELYTFRKIAREIDFIWISFVSTTLILRSDQNQDFLIFPLYLVYKNMCTLIRMFDLLGSFTFEIDRGIFKLKIPQFFTGNLSNTILSYVAGCFEYKDLQSITTLINNEESALAYFSNALTKVTGKIFYFTNPPFIHNHSPENGGLTEYVLKECKNVYRSDIIQQRYNKELLELIPINYINNGKNIFSFYDSIMKKLYGINKDVNIFDQITVAFKQNLAKTTGLAKKDSLVALLDDVLKQNEVQASKIDLKYMNTAFKIHKSLAKFSNKRIDIILPQLLLKTCDPKTHKIGLIRANNIKSRFMDWLADLENRIYLCLVIVLILINVSLLIKFIVTKSK